MGSGKKLCKRGRNNLTETIGFKFKKRSSVTGFTAAV